MSDGFKDLREDLLNLNHTARTCLHSGRNKISRISIAGYDLVIKEFGNSLLSGIVYMFRRSKARRSYHNACELIRRGIGTPVPVAFIEKRGLFGYLKESYYISEYDLGNSLGGFLRQDVSVHRVLAQFAEFVSYLHERGIKHNDLNSSNVRVNMASDGKLRFSLIDLNRMEINPLGVRLLLKERFVDITKFSDLTSDFCFFVREYLRESGLSMSDFKMAIIVKAKESCAADRKKMWKRLLCHKNELV